MFRQLSNCQSVAACKNHAQQSLLRLSVKRQQLLQRQGDDNVLFTRTAYKQRLESLLAQGFPGGLQNTA
jgi:hypothetical protein